ncbi:hypothetical protein BGW38_001483 [Lunasporangiospora selenospora]|uniref:Uncharacterized protein n=1 Tax=Lunasporangiospora selenospora TaxID=979761 RepID=A0A9P6FTP2_9FUNG|nr:hypothetical protein BGW38_001483 [Lunasporangiospora selenospora]
MFRHSIRMSGHEVPVLENLGIEEEVITTPAMSEGIEVAVFRSIDYLQRLLRSSADGGAAMATYRSPIIRMREFENVKRYLKDKNISATNPSSTPGDLYRIITPEGHVKWVCSGHYAFVSRPVAPNAFRQFVEANRGVFNERMGKLDIIFSTSSMAKLFYQYFHLDGAPFIQDLSINLYWPTTQEDFKDLRMAIDSSSCIVSVELQSTKTGPAQDPIIKAKRIDPIFQLMANSRLRSFTLGPIEGFFKRIGVSSRPSHLRMLHLQDQFDFKIETARVDSLIKNCPRLMEFRMGCTVVGDGYLVVQHALDGLDSRQRHQFKRLKLNAGPLDHVDLDYQDGDVNGMELSSSSFETAQMLKYRFTLRKFTIGARFDLDKERALVKGLIQHNRHLSELRIASTFRQFKDTYELVRDTASARMKADPLRFLELNYVTNKLTFPNLYDPQAVIFELGHLKWVDPMALGTLFEEYGWALMSLNIDHNLLSPKEWAALRKSIETLGSCSRLERVEITSLELKPTNVQDLTEVILMSERLSQLRVTIRATLKTETEDDDFWATWVDRISSRITSLEIGNEAPREPKILESTCQMTFPAIEEFFLTSPGFPGMTSNAVDCLTKQLVVMFSGDASNLMGAGLGKGGFRSPDMGSSAAHAYKQIFAPTVNAQTGLIQLHRLHYLGLESLHLSTGDWLKVFEVIDLMSLVELSLSRSNVGDEVIMFLMRRLVPDPDDDLGAPEQQGFASAAAAAAGRRPRSRSRTRSRPRSRTRSGSRHRGGDSEVRPMPKLEVLNLERCYNISQSMKAELITWTNQNLVKCTVRKDG